MATNVVDSAKGQTSLRSFNHKGERMNNSDGQSMTRIDEMVLTSIESVLQYRKR
ncbi:TPA: hypothetical protein ACJ6XF_002663 [Legionella pneumophila]